MERETLFRGLLLAIFIIMKFIRVFYQRRAGGVGFKDAQKRDPWDFPLLILFSVPLSVSVICWLFFPDTIDWARVESPAWHGWTGAAISICGLALYIWTHVALDKNFSFLLRVKKDHTLVDHGPYRKVRHPMYTSFQLLGLGASLMSANWAVAVSWLVIFGVFISLRTRKEEVMLLERFGAQYRAYMLRTGRLVPWI